MKKLLSFLLTLALLAGLTTFALAEESKSVVYWTMWNATEPQGAVIKEAAEAFEAKTGIKIQIEFKGREAQRSALQAALDAGTEIDMFDEDIDRVNLTWGNYLMDLEGIVKETGYEETATKSLIDAARLAGGGTLKSIPYQPFIFDWVYNKAIFKEAGIESKPTTWEEFLDVCQKIKDKGYVPVTSDNAYIHLQYAYQLASYIGEEGVTKVVNEGLWKEEPAALQAAKDIEEMAKRGFFSSTIESSQWPNNQNGEFALGDVAMYLNGTWLPNEIRTIAGEDFEFGFMAYPKAKDGKFGPEAANFGGQVFGISKNSKKANEAFEFITFLTRGEYDKKLAAESLGIPSDPANEEWPAQLADAKELLAQLTTRYSWGAGLEANVDATPFIKENCQKLYGGSITAEQFIENLEALGK